MKPEPQVNLRAVRRLVADYIGSEGCSCCRGIEHSKHLKALAKALRVPKYPDGSGFNFKRFESNETHL